MHLVYNGIEIEVLDVQRWTRDDVMDDSGVDALCVRERISVTGLINGQLDFWGRLQGMSYVKNPLASQNPPRGLPPTVPQNTLPPEIAKFPNRPILTDNAIREHLLKPRRKLIAYTTTPAGVEILLESPARDKLTDERNGPFVTGLELTPLGDAVTFMVAVTFETFTPVCEHSAALVSNRWSSTHVLDETHHLNISYEGVSHFRASVLHANKINPDRLRTFLVPPIPVGFRRVNVVTQGSSDGLQIRWSCTDTQMDHQFVAGVEAGGVWLDTKFTHSISVPGATEGILGAIERGLSLKVNRKWSREEPTPDRPAAAIHNAHPAAPRIQQ